MMSIEDVNYLATEVIRKYDWHTEQLGYGVRLVVNDGVKRASVVITTGENIMDEINRVIEAVDAHEYEELEG